MLTPDGALSAAGPARRRGRRLFLQHLADQSAKATQRDSHGITTILVMETQVFALQTPPRRVAGPLVRPVAVAEFHLSTKPLCFESDVTIRHG